mgnify:CR=1 FL=1
MKKYLLLLSLLLVILLSACGAADQEPHEDEIKDPVAVYEFNIKTLSFIEDDTYDILSGYSDNHTDFLYALNTIQNESITDTEIAAFDHLLTVFDELEEKGKKSYPQILTYSNKELQEMCESYGVTLEPIDIFTFNLLKSYQENITEYKFYNVNISRNDYIEMRLDRDISTDEIYALNQLQMLHTGYYASSYTTFSIDTYSFSELIDKYSKQTSIAFSEEMLAVVEIAYNILVEMENSVEN